jgi:thiamine kinase-like enzyme
VAKNQVEIQMDWKNTHPEVEQIIQQIPEWHDAGCLRLAPLAGLTNTNYSVTVDGERFVLRVSGHNTEQLGINRDHEIEALSAASEAGIGAQVEHFLLPEGHLVTRHIHGRHLTLEEYRTSGNIGRIVNTLRRLHELPLVRATFSPFRRVERYAERVQSMGVPLPRDFDEMLEKAGKVEMEQARDTYPWRRFCHNDLFSVNVLDDGTIRFIDWEFSGVGDIYYDLATLTYAYDSADTLSRGLQEHMLECYFGDMSEESWARLEGMKVMVMLFTAMWGLLQQGMQNKGLVPAVEGFDFLEYSEATFEAMRALP